MYEHTTTPAQTKRPPRPRALDVIAENYPQDLQAIDRWLLWGYVWKPAAGKYDKPPLAIDGSPGSSTNPATWSTYADALAAYRSSRHRFDGLGFVLSPTDNLVGIDLDKCRDRETGVIDEWALKIVRAIDSYTEVSPSGTGLRILLRGSLPPDGRKKGNVETYQDGRYLTITGHHLEETPRTIETRERELLAFHLEHFGPPQGAQPRRSPRPSDSQDVTQVLERMFRSQDGDRYQQLHRGDWSGYPSQSEADAALIEGALYWSGGDRHIADQIYRDSGLYRPKWETRRSAQTLGERTIDRLLGRMTRFYEPPPSTWPKHVTSSEPIAATNGHAKPGSEAAAPAPAAGECSELQAEVEQLRAEVSELRAERAAVLRLLSIDNKELKASDKIVGLTTLLEIRHKQRRLGRGTDALVPISRSAIHQASGLSPSSISGAWSRLVDAGAFPKMNGHKRPSRTNEITGEITELDGPPVEVAYFHLPAATVAASIDHLAQNRPAPNGHGGGRPKVAPLPVTCPDHPAAHIEKRCAECQRLLAPLPSAPASQDATEENDNHAVAVAGSPASQDATLADGPRVPYPAPGAAPDWSSGYCPVHRRELTYREMQAEYCSWCAAARAPGATNGHAEQAAPAHAGLLV